MSDVIVGRSRGGSCWISFEAELFTGLPSAVRTIQDSGLAVAHAGQAGRSTSTASPHSGQSHSRESSGGGPSSIWASSAAARSASDSATFRVIWPVRPWMPSMTTVCSPHTTARMPSASSRPRAAWASSGMLYAATSTSLSDIGATLGATGDCRRHSIR